MSIASSGNSVKCLYFVRYSFVSKGTKSDVHVTFIRVDNRWTIPVTYLPRLFATPPSPATGEPQAWSSKQKQLLYFSGG